MKLKKLKRKVLTKLLPSKFAYPAYRQALVLNFEMPLELEVRIARTKDELENAFRLLHDAYVKAELMRPDPSGLRVTKYHALPTTTTIIALWNGEVVGTMSLIRRGAFGLPMESIFDLTSYIKTGANILEASALAVRPDFSGRRSEILFPMCRYLHDYSVKYFGTDYIGIAVNPTWMTFYKGILLFNELKQRRVENYQFVNGAPAAGGVLNLRTFYKATQEAYKKMEMKSNIHHYFHQVEFPNLVYPERRYSTITDPVLTPELFNYFFKERTPLLGQLSEYEIRLLKQIYANNETNSWQPLLESVSPAPSLTHKAFFNRDEVRFDVNYRALLYGASDNPIELQITNVSEHGVSVRSPQKLRTNQIYNLKTNLGLAMPVSLQVELRWSSPRQSLYGLRILSANNHWSHLLTYLHTELKVPGSNLQRKAS